MKKLLFVLIPFLMAMTPQEAEQKYRELGCHRVESADPTCDAVMCDVVDEVVKMSVVEWDVSVPEPIPVPDEPTLPPVPSCVATWCNLPLQSCALPPLTGGTDSCGNPCSKPSFAFPNCILLDGSIGPKP